MWFEITLELYSLAKPSETMLKQCVFISFFEHNTFYLFSTHFLALFWHVFLWLLDKVGVSFRLTFVKHNILWCNFINKICNRRNAYSFVFSILSNSNNILLFLISTSPYFTASLKINAFSNLSTNVSTLCLNRSMW